MYCRRCYYDLRGQVAHRCPECGTAFDPDKAETFLARRPRGAGRVWYWFQRRRVPIIVTLTLLWCVTIWIVSTEVPLLSRYVGAGFTSTNNLKLILTQWILQQYENPDSRPFDVGRAKKEMPSMPSSWSEIDVARRKFALLYALKAAPFYAVPTLVYAALLLPFVRRRARKAMIAFVALLVVLLITSADPQAVATTVFPGRYSFIQDYVYVADVDLTSNPNAGSTIAAYDWRSFQRPANQKRIVGLADGLVMRMSENEAKALFAANGLPYPDASTSNP